MIFLFPNVRLLTRLLTTGEPRGRSTLVLSKISSTTRAMIASIAKGMSSRGGTFLITCTNTIAARYVGGFKLRGGSDKDYARRFNGADGADRTCAFGLFVRPTGLPQPAMTYTDVRFIGSRALSSIE